MLQGIDIASIDGAAEWHQVKAAGNSFVFVRAAYGDHADEAAPANCAAARASGLSVGVYHFVRTSRSYPAQLKLMLGQLSALKVGPGDLAPVIDVEDNPHYDGVWNPANNATYIAFLQQWLDAVAQKVGKPPIIYTRAQFWQQLGNPAGFGAYPLWIANYVDNIEGHAPHIPAGWQDYDFWQYSESGNVPGVHGHADMNVCKAASLAPYLI